MAAPLSLSRAQCLQIARQFVRMARDEIERPRSMSVQTEHAIRERVRLRVRDLLALAVRWRDVARTLAPGSRIEPTNTPDVLIAGADGSAFTGTWASPDATSRDLERAHAVRCTDCRWRTLALGNGPWRCQVCRRGQLERVTS